MFISIRSSVVSIYLFIILHLFIYLSTFYLCWFIDISISFIPYPYAQLVGGFKHFLFPIIYGITLPIDVHIFQRGRSTTNQTTTHRMGWREILQETSNSWSWCGKEPLFFGEDFHLASAAWNFLYPIIFPVSPHVSWLNPFKILLDPIKFPSNHNFAGELPLKSH